MEQSNNELCHYGVMGMKWGVRRANKSLLSAKSSGDKDKKAKALDSLEKHKGKITKKLAKLDKEHKRLEKQDFKNLTKNDVVAARYEQKAARQANKANRAWTQKSAEKHMLKYEILSAKAKSLRANSTLVRAKIEKNEALQKTFKQTLSDVDNTLVSNGRKYVNK